jgi:hypothetical protein
MTAPLRQQSRQHIADPVASFIARAKAKAVAWKTGEISLHDAVDALQQAAEAYGLVIELGQDAVQAIMVEAFAPARGDLPRDHYDGSTFAAARPTPVDSRLEKLRRLIADDVSLERAWHEINTRAPDDVAIATLWAAEYLVQQGDAERFRRWLDQHSADERACIRRHLEAKRCRSHKSK